MKPKIILTSRIDSDDLKQRAYVNKSYIDAVQAGGGSCMIFPFGDDAMINDYVQFFDGLIVTGGEDVDARFFNEPMHPLAVAAPLAIDETDLALIKAFLIANKPILGICRGIQVLNVAMGGSLIQDINSYNPQVPADRHQQGRREPVLENYKAAHQAAFTKGSVMAEIYGLSYGVNSFHHQAIKDVADKLQVTGISTDDGIIEAVEFNQQVIGVQWHPERMISDPKHLQLFKYFISQCRTNAKR
ncbi:putative glutamine amidotransferase [bioreactor metagenome]|uniref:Putative glutamine amidotransferase n=1 Tax=bioreactor metagenome TaxID=1076179 RepID=A0A644ZNW9_9ZZZZ|nr:gamma-glutamyl-gamma-aminobutyrate hydrolase family protein [Erysipelotrichaceae bacterium]